MSDKYNLNFILDEQIHVNAKMISYQALTDSMNVLMIYCVYAEKTGKSSLQLSYNSKDLSIEIEKYKKEQY